MIRKRKKNEKSMRNSIEISFFLEDASLLFYENSVKRNVFSS